MIQKLSKRKVSQLAGFYPNVRKKTFRGFALAICMESTNTQLLVSQAMPEAYQHISERGC